MCSGHSKRSPNNAGWCIFYIGNCELQFFLDPSESKTSDQAGHREKKHKSLTCWTRTLAEDKNVFISMSSPRRWCPDLNDLHLEQLLQVKPAFYAGWDSVGSSLWQRQRTKETPTATYDNKNNWNKYTLQIVRAIIITIILIIMLMFMIIFTIMLIFIIIPIIILIINHLHMSVNCFPLLAAIFPTCTITSWSGEPCREGRIVWSWILPKWAHPR